MAIVREEVWLDTQGDGIGYRKLSDAVKKRLKFLFTRYRNTKNEETPEETVVNNQEEIIYLLQLLKTEEELNEM